MNESEQLTEAVLADTATAAQRTEFSTRIAADGTLRREYLAQMRVHALLQWRNGAAEPAGAVKVIPFPSGARCSPWLAIAALLAVLGAVAALLWPGGEKAHGLVAAEVLHAADAVIFGEKTAPRSGDRRTWRVLDLQAGLLRVRLDSGAILGAEAPAKIEFLSPMHIRVLAGRITADAGAAHGFTVETSRTRVVDLGTRFGVDAGADRTDVVVFDGAVELHDPAPQAAAVQRLEQGEAVRIAAAGARQAIVSISAGQEPEQWSAGGGGLFRAVRDNRRAPDALKFYQVVPGGMQEDTRAYVDRAHEWNGLDAAGLPEFLRGADLVRTFNDDKRETDLQITVEFARPATLYLFLDKKPAPAWVTSAGFTDTGAKIGLDEGPSGTRVLATANGPGESIDRVFSVWKLELRGAHAIELGPPRDGPTGAKAMYGIAAQPLLP